MTRISLTFLVLISLLGSATGLTAAGAEPFTASWHGFDRFDFLLDEAALTLAPTQASAEEGMGVTHQVAGQRRCVLVVPKESAPGRPWSWRGRYFDHEPQAEIELLKRGFHVAFVQSDEIEHWDAWYGFLVEKHGLSPKPAFVGMSGGGRNAFTWATKYPDRVSCIYADNPLIARESLMKLDQLVEHDVPLLHICGSLDPLSGNHTLPIESLYHHLGGRISVLIKDGTGHHPHSLRDPTLIADFITRSLEPADPAPAFVGQDFARSSFYSVENCYSEFPTEGLYVTCRGAWFSGTYDRYEFKPDRTTGNVTVIVPKTAAPGKPWVLRADLALRDAGVDLALLRKGFHIVTGPRPRDPNFTVLEEWTALYEYLVDQGFSGKPVLECAGAAAGEVYDWAIANPEKVSCIYGENPVLRNYSSQTQPLDNLAPLAGAGVPLLHVCGSLDPWLETQTRVVQERYEALSGRITVMIRNGKGHYPLAPENPQPVVDFIVESVAARDASEESTETLPPLVDLGPGQTYRGAEGGLYPGASNVRPAAHDAAGRKIAREIVPLDSDGNPDPVNGRIVFIPVSVSNGYGAWHRGDETDTSTTFMTRANANPAKNPKLLIAYGFEYQLPGGNAGAGDPGPDSLFYRSLDQALHEQGITPQQVQVVWLFMPVAGKSWTLNLSPEAMTFPADAQESKQAWEEIVHAISVRYPNVKIIYNSTKGAMYMMATATENSEWFGGPIEPWNHDVGWSVKWVIEDQINGDPKFNYDPARGPVNAPWLSWGPYYWSHPDGTPRSDDGFVWTRADVAEDGLHPSLSGLTKYATLLLHQMTTDSTATPWFLEPDAPSNQPPTIVEPASTSANPVSGKTTALSVLAADDGGEANLTYTWSGSGPGNVTFSVNGPNRARNTTASFQNPGRYTLQVTIADTGGFTATSSLTVTVADR